MAEGGDSTWVLPSPAPLDEADDEEEEHDDGHCTHDADQPALGGEVHLVSGIGCRPDTRTHKGESECEGE